MDRYWILSANASEARLYHKVTGGRKLALVRSWYNPQSRFKNRQLVSDRPGHYQSRGTGHGAFVQSTEPKNHEADVFAKLLAHHLDQAKKAGAYEYLLIYASPRFAGRLRKQLGKPVRRVLKSSVAKDYMHLDEVHLDGMVRRRIRSLQPLL